MDYNGVEFFGCIKNMQGDMVSIVPAFVLYTKLQAHIPIAVNIPARNIPTNAQRRITVYDSR